MIGIDQLREQARAWARRVVEVYNTPVPPHLEKDKQELLAYAQKVKTTIEKATGPLDELMVMNQMNLGLAPVLIGAGVIAAASAAIAGFYVWDKRLMNRVNAYNDLQRGGLNHDQALQVMDDQNSFTGNIARTSKYLVPVSIAGAIALYFWSNKNGRHS